MPTAIALGNRRELFVDDLLVDSLAGTSLKLHTPQKANSAIEIDKPWEGPFNAGACVVPIDGGYRMYYRGLKTDGLVHLCCAESTDGVRWQKPDLGIHEIMGTRSNNVIVPDTPNYDVFLDTRPGVDSTERIKMTRYSIAGKRLTPYFAGAGDKLVHLFVSHDGLSFTPKSETPIFTCDWPNAFDSHNIFFWSEAEGQYVCYFRFMDGFRTMARMTSPDLLQWSEPTAMTYGDTPREELYTNSTLPYFRAPHIYLAMPARFMPGRRVVSDDQLASLQVASSGEHVYYEDCSEAVFMSTRAGTTEYDRAFMESYVRPGPGAENWVSRTNYPLHGLIQTAPDELSFYVSRDYAQPTWHIRRYRLRLDGFASINAPYRGGEMRTKTVTFTGKQLEINYATGAAGELRIELQDANGAPLPRFSTAACDPIVGDETSRIVSWNQNSDLSLIRGETCRIRFVMKDADLYSICFV
jgi:hypothetical protein